MKNFHLTSFSIGLGSGVLILVVLFGAMRVLGGNNPNRPVPGMMGGNGQFQRGMGGNNAMMAERLGMTEAELQAELDSGKTMQELMEEQGVEMPLGNRQGINVPVIPSASGSMTESGSLTTSGSDATTSTVSN